MNVSGHPAPLHSGHLAYTLASRFFDELVAMGIERVVASPGSRSTALITAAATTPGIALDIQHDERVAAFVALGYGKGAQRPAVLICTSGSAGSHYLPAVLEGHYSGVPIMMLTADRPAELQGVGAPQTVDQSDFFSGYTRLTRMLPDIDVLGDGDMIDLAREAYSAAVVGRGPVHVNWPFPEPLEPGNLRPGQKGGAESSPTGQPMAHSAIGLQPSQSNAIGSADQLAFRHLLQVRRGFIVVGPDDHPPDARQLIFDFARNRGWPVFADIGSGLRTGGPPKLVIPWIEPAFEVGGLADRRAPQVILRIGRMPTAKAFSQWLTRHHEVPVVLVNSHVEIHDFTGTSDATIQSSPKEALDSLGDGAGRDPEWLVAWERASARADHAVATALLPSSETAETVASLRQLDDGTSVHLASSMPIRHADGFVGNLEHDIRVLVNRGTNGIDGTIATTLGESMALDGPAVAILGDIAFLHDAGGLLAAGRSGRNLTLVVLDNGGGGIFSFLPIADVLPGETFNRLFRTPHRTDIRALAEAAGARVHTDVEAIQNATRTPGLDVVVLETDMNPVPAFRAAKRAAGAAMLAEDHVEEEAAEGHIAPDQDDQDA